MGKAWKRREPNQADRRVRPFPHPPLSRQKPVAGSTLGSGGPQRPAQLGQEQAMECREQGFSFLPSTREPFKRLKMLNTECVKY